MIRRRTAIVHLLLPALITVSTGQGRVVACATCFGQSDSALAQGMNWGIFSLLIVILAVLGTFAGFFVYLVRRAAAVSVHRSTSGPSSESSGTGLPVLTS